MSEAIATTPQSQPHSKTKVTYEAVVVSETHWDRDWYMTFQQYRRRLVYVMDRLLDLLESKPAFKTFTFDGQACVLEDYLRIRPENADRIRKLADKGRLIFGPWYTLPDEWLVSAESFIRNHFAGRRTAKGYGKLSTSGYCPDAFGHCNQLPQILHGLGLSSAIFTRGMGEEADTIGLTFRWQSADPEIDILAVYQQGGYGNASALGYPHRHEDMPQSEFDLDTVISATEHILEKMEPRTRTRALLFNNGVDHMEAQWNLPEAIEHVNQSDLPVTLRHGTFQQFVDAVNAENPKLENYQGEFHLGYEQVILPGTLSTRIYLKKANDLCESKLEGVAEPLSAFNQLLLGGEDLRAFTHEAWRLLLLNHPHDDICGCSIDQVHREMITRFDECEQIADIVAHESLRKLAKQQRPAKSDAITAIAVSNPHPWERPAHIETVIILPRDIAGIDFGEPPRHPGWHVAKDEKLRLVGPDGTAIPAEFTHLRERFTHTFSDFDPVFWQCPCHEFRVRFATDALPPSSVTVLSVERGEGPTIAGISASDTAMENEHLAVTVNANGTVDILDKATGHQHTGLLLFEDVGDGGDEYDFSGLDEPGTVTTAGCAATRKLQSGGIDAATIRVEIPWKLPAKIAEGRQSRAKEMVDNDMTVDLTLRKDSRVLEAEIRWKNRAEDHRLRAVMPSDLVTNHTSAEAHFDVIDRPLEPVVPTKKWVQDPLNFHPMDRFVSLSDGEKGLAVLGRGIKEYEATAIDGGTKLEVTILRSVGWLSRDDLKNGRPIGNAGPQLPAPEAQCHGKQVVHLAIAPHSGTWQEGQIPRRAVEFNVPMIASQCDIPEGDWEPQAPFVSVGHDDLLVTATKIAEDRDSLVVRVLNLGKEPITAPITVGFPVAEAHQTNLAETREAKLNLQGSAVTITARPRQLVTVEFVPKS